MTPSPLSSLGGNHAHRFSAHGRSYTFFVRLARLVLPALALVLLSLVVLKLSGNPLQDQLSQIAPELKTTPGQSSLEKARYEAVETEGRPFVLTADQATRVMTEDKTSTSIDPTPQDGETVDLKQPRARLLDETGAGGFALEASEGRFEQGPGQLRLEGGVTLSDDKGYALDLQSVDVDLMQRRAKSDQPVSGDGPAGHIKASGVTVEEGGQSIIFSGPATMTFKEQPAASGDKK